MAEKKAAQRLIRGDDGRVRVIFIDLKTLLPVLPLDLSNYDIINAGNTYFEPVKDINDPETPSEQTSGDQINPPERFGDSQGHEPSGEETGAAPSTGAPSRPSAPSRPGRGITQAPSLDEDTSVGRGIVDESRDVTEDAADAVGSGPGPQSGTGFTGGPGMGPGGPSGTSGPTGTNEGRSKATIGYSNQGAQRSGRLDPAFEDALATAVGSYLGPGHHVDVTSGKGHKSGGGNSNHPSGFAADFDVYGPDGKALDATAMEGLAMALGNAGFTGLGIGPGYMDGAGGKGSRMHADMTHTGNPAAWGAGGTKSDNPNTAAVEGLTDQSYSSLMGSMGFSTEGKNVTGRRAPAQATPYHNPPTPTSRPDDLGRTDDTVAQGVIGKSLDVTDQDVSAMAEAIAGEMSPQSLEALGRGDPTARSEVGQIGSTIANRAITTGKSITDTLAPSQYNSLMGSKRGTTSNNYSKFGPAIEDALNDAMSGKIDVPNPGASHYYNPEVANPSWGPGMGNQTSMGGHTFGNVGNEYGGGKGPGIQGLNNTSRGGFQSMSDTYAENAINNSTPDPGELGGLGGAFGGVGSGPGRGTSAGGPGIGGQTGPGGFGAGSATGGFGGGPSAEGAPGTGAGYSGGVGFGFGGDTSGYGGPGEGVGGGPGMGAGVGYGGPGEGVGGGPGMGGGVGYGGPGEGVGGGPGMGGGSTGGGYSGMGGQDSPGEGHGGMGYGGSTSGQASADGTGAGVGTGPGGGSVGYGAGGVGTSAAAGYGQAAEGMGAAGISGVGDTSDSSADFSGW